MRGEKGKLMDSEEIDFLLDTLAVSRGLLDRGDCSDFRAYCLKVRI